MAWKKSRAINMTSQHIEIAVAKHFCYRRQLIVPNVSWGMGLRYEADVVVLRPSDWGIEVEIKISGADIKADLKKKHQHDSNLFKELWFAVPTELNNHYCIPSHAGILSIDNRQRVTVIRKPVANKNARKWTPKQRMKLLHLASMRTWALKQTILQRGN
jgi:hypothetical protein